MATLVPILEPPAAFDEGRQPQSCPEENPAYTQHVDKIDISESNILSSLFDGIPMAQSQTDVVERDTRKPIECVNITRSNHFGSGHHNEVLLKTGFREPNETRVILKHRPLGIRIKPVNVHGFGAMVSKITNPDVYALGVRQNMIITGLNNKDLLGCTFDQITNVIKSAHPPITLRLKYIQAKAKTTAKQTPSYSVRKNRSISAPSIFQYGPYRNGTNSHPQRQNDSSDTKCRSTNNSGRRTYARRRAHKAHKPQKHNLKAAALLTPPTPQMLASFAADHMPSTTVLSSSSDEEQSAGDIYTDCEDVDGTPNVGRHDVKEEDEDDDGDDDEEDEDEDDGGRSCVSWHNIRLGASVIKHGGILDLTEETAFKLAYGMLIRQGLNVYEIRAAMRLIREQPQHVPSLESFKHLTVAQQRRAPCGALTPTCMPQEWLKEYNFNDVNTAANGDTQHEYEQEADSDCSSQSTVPKQPPNRYRTVIDDDVSLLNQRRRTPSTSISSGPNIGSLERERNRIASVLSSGINSDVHADWDENKTINESATTSLPCTLPQQRLHSQPIKGYIDFFDDNDSSQSQSPSHSASRSAQMQRAFDLIGLKSPVDSECDDEDDNNDCDNGVVDDADEHEHEHEQETIGVSSYISTDSADMPQFMKHWSLPTIDDHDHGLQHHTNTSGKPRGVNILHHLRRMTKKRGPAVGVIAHSLGANKTENSSQPKLSKFKQSMVRGLNVGTDTPAVQSLFKKLTSPKSNCATSHDTNHGSQTLTSSSWNDVKMNSCVE